MKKIYEAPELLPVDMTECILQPGSNKIGQGSVSAKNIEVKEDNGWDEYDDWDE